MGVVPAASGDSFLAPPSLLGGAARCVANRDHVGGNGSRKTNFNSVI